MKHLVIKQHWFKILLFIKPMDQIILAECTRILEPDGKVIVNRKMLERLQLCKISHGREVTATMMMHCVRQLCEKGIMHKDPNRQQTYWMNKDYAEIIEL